MKQWNGKTGGGELGQRALLLLFRYFNVKVGYVILYVVVPFYMLFARKGFESIYDYFRQRQSYSPWQAFWATYRNHHLFGQMLLDRFALYAGQKNRFRVEISGAEYFDHLLNSPLGGIVASAHVGNFEIMGYLLHQDRKAIHALVYGGESQTMQRNREQIMGRNNIRTIGVTQDMSHIFAINDALSRAELITIPCDRVWTGNKRTSVDFMGAQANFPTGTFHIASKFKTNILSVFVVKEGFSSYKVIIEPIHNTTPTDMTQQFVGQIETLIKQYPLQWFNFYNFWEQ